MYFILKDIDNFDTLIVNNIMSFLPFYHIRNYIHDLNEIWYKRLIFTNISAIKKNDMKYSNWFKIFHYKDHHVLIRYEHKLIKQLITTLPSKDIIKIHHENLNHCHKKNFMNYTYYT